MNTQYSNCVQQSSSLQVEHLPQASLWQREVGGNVNITAEYPHKKIERSILTALFLKCQDVLDHRTFIDDYFKILDFIEWLKEFYPEKAKFLTNKS